MATKIIRPYFTSLLCVGCNDADIFYKLNLKPKTILKLKTVLQHLWEYM